jgi:tight adherence protein B
MWIIIISGAVAVAALFGYITMALMPGGEATAAEDRLQVLAGAGKGSRGPGNEVRSLLIGTGLDDTKSWIEATLGGMPRLSAYIDQADVKITPSRFVATCLAFFGFGAIVIVVSPIPMLLAPIGGGMMLMLPVMWLMMKRKKRLAKLGRQLPDALELLSRSLRSGHSLAAGFNLVATEMQEPLSREFGRVFEEQNLGIPLEEALQDMADRIPNMDVRFFATAVTLQRTTGGDLAEILDKIGHLVRERLQILGQVQALTGEGRLSGVVLLGLPPVLFLVMLYLNYEYIMTLFTDSLGRKMLGFALCTQLVGALAIKKIITIKV